MGGMELKKRNEASWQQLQQKPRWTWQRVRWILLRMAMAVFGITAIVAFIGWFAKKQPVQPLEKVYFSTDGVLQRTWFLSRVAIPWGKGLMSIDLEALQKKCLQCQQIESVVITRAFPNALKIRLKEQKPCAKLRLSKNGRSYVGLVSRNGVIFQPIQYTHQQLKNFITLSEIPTNLLQQGTIVGFEKVARLLQFLAQKAPDAFYGIQRVSLQHFDPFLEEKWQTVELSMRPSWTLVFPIQQLEEALSKLRSILRGLSLQQRKNLRRLNLALTHPVVEFF